jgi:hypothetical protein
MTSPAGVILGGLLGGLWTEVASQGLASCAHLPVYTPSNAGRIRTRRFFVPEVPT